MNRDPASWLSPLVAVLVMAAAIVQTLAALGVTGAFGWRVRVPTAVISPAYQAVERALDLHDPGFKLAGLRDPFMYGHAPDDNKGRVPPPAPRLKPLPPRPVELPVLTAIVWDADPRALVRWKGREWTVREGGLFDEFQVASIRRDQVTLRRGDSSLVLTRRNPGE
jgi:hypothetical protein